MGAAEVKLTFWTFVEKHADYVQLAVAEFNKANPEIELVLEASTYPYEVVVVRTVFRLLLADTGGLVNTFLGLFGIAPLRWLLLPELAVPSLAILALWRWTGMNIVYFSSGLTAIPPEIYEAAKIDGAQSFALFRYITLPLIKPIIVFVITISIIGGYQVFVEPYILYPGGRTPGEAGLTVAVYLYRTAFRNFNMGYAAAIGVALAGIIFVVSLTQFQFSGFFKK